MYILHNYVCTYFNHIQADRDNDDWTHICIYVYIAACIARKKMYTNMYVDIATKYKKKQLYRYMYVLCAYCDQYQGKL